jgi:hypothetical protein
MVAHQALCSTREYYGILRWALRTTGEFVGYCLPAPVICRRTLDTILNNI